MKSSWWINLFALAAVAVAITSIAAKNRPGAAEDRLLNVSYDPTRELYQALNPLFVAHYEKETGRHIEIAQSHGGSSRQSRVVSRGEEAADVVTLGLFSDIDVLRKAGLIAEHWTERLPNHSQPYTSTIVFVVRRGNPKHVRDWPDLVQSGIEVVTPDPKTSGNGKLSVLAAWAAIMARGGTEADGKAYLKALFAHVPVLDQGARGAAITFAVQEIGDVHLTWENEALREVADAKGGLEIVYPPVSLRADVARNGTQDAAKAYLEFLFSDEAQEAMGRLGYRPYKAELLRKFESSVPPITLLPITAIARDWDDAQQIFFSENGILDTIMRTAQR
jgi:sulfate transport system substrate-binding protein